MMDLGRILSVLPEASFSGEPGEIDIVGITDDSRMVKPGYLFAAVGGTRTDGHAYLAEAVQRGAVAVIMERKMNIPPVFEVHVPDSCDALARIASCYWDYPCQGLTVVGVTGTNGKTTVSLFVQRILQEAGMETGLIGTLRYEVGSHSLSAPNTTPGVLQLQAYLRQMVEAEMKACVMEVSSHALAQRRVQECRFDVRVFTNLSRDHLDYHSSMEDYYEAKRLLFGPGFGKDAAVSVINADDPWGRRLSGECHGAILTYGIEIDADVKAFNCRSTIEGLTFSMQTPAGTVEMTSALSGSHNIYNILAAAAVGFALKIPAAAVSRAVSRVTAIPGRFEKIAGPGFTVVVDYAHTDDALKNLLQAVRKVCRGRVITVFGCGGDRDRGKRPLMGKAAAELSDMVVVTSDNPRTEDPAQIIEEILAGVKEAGPVMVEVFEDRRRAIQVGIDAAAADDVVVIAGKGHEDYQILGEQKVHFDDREEARNALELRRNNEVGKR
jgi:UDP-N-acetylmuramoyl-L-alanyl-D-glutamate--2,6-diaminopimelate ligase